MIHRPTDPLSRNDQRIMMHLNECDRSHQTSMATLYHAECELRETLAHLHHHARGRILNGDPTALNLSHHLDKDVQSIANNITTLCQEVRNLFHRLSDQGMADPHQTSIPPRDDH